MSYTDRHQMFQTMQKLATSAQDGPISVKCDTANQAIYVQRVFYEFKRTAKSGEVYELFHSIRTKRKGMTVWFLPKAYSLDPVNDALGISTIADKAHDIVSKALSAHEDRPDGLNGDTPDQSDPLPFENEPEPQIKVKRPFVRHAGHFVKGDPRLCRDKGMLKGGQEPSDRIWSYLEKQQGQSFDEIVLRKEISHTKLSYDLVKFDTGLKWLADNGFITIEGNVGKRRISTKA